MIMTTNKEIKEQFENMQCMPIFEINLSDYIETLEEEYTYCYINYDEETNTLQYGGATNAGIHCIDRVAYDKCFSLDENLDVLLELFIENSIKDYYNEN